VIRAEHVETKLLRREVDLQRGLRMSEWLFDPKVPISVESESVRRYLEKETPVDSKEIVEWMHYAAADNTVFGGAAEDYNRLGSQLLSGSDDPWIPGLKVGDLRAPRMKGATVRRDGYAVIRTPEGNFRVPAYGKATFAKGRILAWGTIPAIWGLQWVLTLLQWKELAETPITERVRFPNSQGRVAPQFFTVTVKLPVPLITLRIGLTSNKDQKIKIRGRGTEGNYEKVLFEDEFEVEKGESETTYNVFGFPFVSTFTLELQPADKTTTILDYLETIP